jgi:ribosomal protein S18 acetylase RimI-like enzyme
MVGNAAAGGAGRTARALPAGPSRPHAGSAGRPPSLIALRAFAPADDAALIAWVRTPEELLRFAGPSLTWPLDVAQLERARGDPELETFTAYVPGAEDRPVGHLGLALRDGVARLGRVIVAPERRGEGLGRAMLSAALDVATSRGAHDADLVVYEDNVAGIGLYRSLGFELVPTSGGDPRLRRMRRHLPAA